MAGFVSPRLGIRLEPGEGPNNLKIIGPGEQPFATHFELAALREAERLRADEQAQLTQAERLRADEQAQLAQAERLRGEQMAARLRELGLEPD
jgi:hypothetical protein